MVREFGTVIDSGIGERRELTGWGKETFWDGGNSLYPIRGMPCVIICIYQN